jgi:hypothetical protein
MEPNLVCFRFPKTDSLSGIAVTRKRWLSTSSVRVSSQSPSQTTILPWATCISE